jgi:uncharacterized membrane protein (DUF2068 family)
MISRSASRTLVKSVAVFEAIKGGLVLLAGFGVLTLMGRDLRALANALVGWLHLDPKRHFASVFIEAASNTTDARLWFIAGFGFVYAAFRFTEAFGLWKSRAWAEWLALVSGGIYLPVEVYELIRRVTWVRVTALVANLAVVILMGVVLWQNRRRNRDVVM